MREENPDRSHREGAPLDKARGAFLGLAAGDALGWPQEGRWRVRTGDGNAEPRLEFREWTRRSGGRFRAFEEVIRPGEYSDDTQLTLAVARSRTEHGENWWEALTRWELPFWTLYERGGGGATKRAAQAWAAGTPPWRSTRTAEFHKYFGAGGNGVAMRVLPHSLFSAAADDPAPTLSDVVRDGIATHGHPRALVGATAYAFAARWLVRQNRTLKFGELPAALIDQAASWSVPPSATLHDGGAAGWCAAADRAVGGSYERMWHRTVEEMRDLLTKVVHGVEKGAMADDRAVLRELGCFGRENGAGTVSVAAAVYLVARHAAQPHQALFRAAFERGADTDTLAALAGGLAGCLAGLEWLPHQWLKVQDASYLREMAVRVAAGPSQAKQEPIERFGFTRDNVFSLARKGNGEVALGPLRMTGSMLPNPKPLARSLRVRACQFRTWDGWTLYLNKLERTATPRELPPSQIRIPPARTVPGSKEELYAVFCRQLPHVLGERPLKQEELRGKFGLVPSQLSAWLKRAEEDGTIRRASKRPLTYVLNGGHGLQ